ncbi:DUF3302 domain-containing protein [Aeromonas bivalvium]|uniref:DUF3302 domain-containing protein n=1 Tax=Aeromonas bivalvium TaxID=440079 RepID=UPI0038CF441E
MALDYIALGILVFVVLVMFYGIIVIHDIPYEIAKHRQHPHQDAIHVAGWVSLFTLHVLWPFLWIWATLYRPERGWGFNQRLQKDEIELASLKQELADLKSRINNIEQSEQQG